ncbi:TetR/AcrR family transcriptional regulator [Prevotella melaninogenica]|uniref:TetR/AcrR family transcriptional regulator n=1 Tax=Prevotella melaninogenica TaxID=28132 RepID=A0A7D4GGS6_9BACT|nr:TetR/AcrR family transcriptional regulator [Prevotella melaninogenica]EFC73618.1 transcriptional regulator, TetR family [Prevotella melaninogenica D18]QKH87666.1 TetR/AcrR family transcriptional regulator [Prevotella melaninogenica]
MYNTATETTYRQELKEKILITAINLFHKHGIRSVKMDDIANELKISKRTLYEIYSNKEELLLEVVRRDKQREKRRMDEIGRTGSNVINIIIEISRFRLEEFSQINPLFFEEIHKYPELLAYVHRLHDERESDAHAFIQRGIDEGLFLPNLNYNIVRTMTVALQNAIMNQYLYKKYDIKELAHVSILFFIRAYCTMKGVKLLDEELNSLPLS